MRKLQRLQTVCIGRKKSVFFSDYSVQTELLQKALLVTGKHTHFYAPYYTMEEEMEIGGEGSVVYAVVPNVPELAFARSVLKQAKEKKATVILLCSDIQNDFQKYADYQLSFEGTKTSMDIYFFMILNNVVKYDYSQRYLEGYLEELYG